MQNEEKRRKNILRETVLEANFVNLVEFYILINRKMFYGVKGPLVKFFLSWILSKIEMCMIICSMPTLGNHRQVQRMKEEISFIEEKGELGGVALNERPLQKSWRSRFWPLLIG